MACERITNSRAPYAGACLTALVLSAATSEPATALEFVAEQVTKIDRRVTVSSIYYRDDRWRLEHRNGAVGVTIVRKDKDLMWLLLPKLRRFETVAFDPQFAPRLSITLEGEINREIIGDQILDGHPTVLYEVEVREADTRRQSYYQWVATDIGFPLKLARKDGAWIIEYRRVRLHTLSDQLFQMPMHYLPLEEAAVTPSQFVPLAPTNP